MSRGRRKTGLRLFAGLLAAGVLMVQPAMVFAEETVAREVSQVSIQAKVPDSGETVEVSETVRIMLDEGSIYLDESTGFLRDAVTGLRVHPISGEQEVVPETPVSGDEESESEETEESRETEVSGETEGSKETESPKETEGSKETESPKETEGSKETEGPEETESSIETESSGEIESSEESETPQETESDKAAEVVPVESPSNWTEIQAGFLTSEQFSKVRDRIQYNVTVPIEGLPSFITQEMIVGALKCQDETGYPASVTIAQIIQESGYGSYGPGGDSGEGLSWLAYQYCNLFGIKGKGTAGSVNMNTMEMTPAGNLYLTSAGFRAYHTYTEAIEDRSKLLTEMYSDLIKDVKDANTFAMRIGGRWATDINYGKNLIKVMKTYDLYRLDDLTLIDFSKMIGRFANPCPGSTITSTFGYRTFDHQFHKGLDLGTGTENIPTYAAEAGTVTFAGYSESAGNYIIIDHGDGLVTKYMHHAEIYVNVGQTVEKGQQIGLSGTTGDSTGNHLHFQVEEKGIAVDPLLYLQDEGNGETLKMRSRFAPVYEKMIQLNSLYSNISSKFVIK